MGKLHLKRTPAEQAEHDLRKARKAARKAAKHARRYDDDPEDEASISSSHKRRKTGKGYDPEHVEDSAGHSHAYKPDYDFIYAQIEEERFREKMWGAFEDDDRLDSMEARFNNYAHIPRRWRSGGMERMDDELDIDPQMMEEEDYAEWVRANMWKKQHAAEFAEQERKKAEHAAREARAKAARAETRRIEKEEEERWRRKRTEREHLRESEIRAAYESKWKDLLNVPLSDSKDGPALELRFQDIPWPVFVSDVGPSERDKKGKARAVEVEVTVEDLTVDAISAFLLPTSLAPDDAPSAAEIVQKERRDKLRETMLRFHPDKFEGRILRHVRQSDQEHVREAVGRITRAVTELLADKRK